MATNPMYRMTSGTNHRACTAKSPKMSAPITLKELDSAEGVLSDASFKASIANSKINS